MNDAKNDDESARQSSRPARAQPSGEVPSRKLGPAYYLSWAEEIYGPATEEEIMKGIRASWFDESALYWHEGMSDWKPVYTFTSQDKQSGEESWRNRRVAPPPNAPSLSGRRSRKSDANRSKSSRPRPRDGRYNLLFVATFALLAVVLTVGILLLLMLV